MRSIAKAATFIILIVVTLYVAGFFAVVPVAATMSGLPRLLAVNTYDMLYRPVRKELPYRNLVRTYWFDYMTYWCDGVVDCPVFGDEPKGGGLFEADR